MFWCPLCILQDNFSPARQKYHTNSPMLFCWTKITSRVFTLYLATLRGTRAQTIHLTPCFFYRSDCYDNFALAHTHACHSSIVVYCIISQHAYHSPFYALCCVLTCNKILQTHRMNRASRKMFVVSTVQHTVQNMRKHSKYCSFVVGKLDLRKGNAYLCSCEVNNTKK